jgi:peptide chain release factor
VKKALERLHAEALEMGVTVSLLEQLAGPVDGTLRSVLLQLDCQTGLERILARNWSGSMLWICESPYRKTHKRKNWFLSGAAFCPPSVPPECGAIRYEAIRASGPGGQHVNKTDSAIRATHLATGLTVKVQSERSQHANKRLAGQLLASKLAALAKDAEGRTKAERHALHREAERGNAARVFAGADFVERAARTPALKTAER